MTTVPPTPEVNVNNAPVTPPKRGRGRPRKTPLPADAPPAPKRPVGRPRSQPSPPLTDGNITDSKQRQAEWARQRSAKLKPYRAMCEMKPDEALTHIVLLKYSRVLDAETLAVIKAAVDKLKPYAIDASQITQPVPMPPPVVLPLPPAPGGVRA